MNRPAHPLSVAPVAGPVTPLAGPAATFAGDPENFIELGYGTGPRCIQCRRNVSMCLCNVPEPEPEYFRPGGYFDPDADDADGFVYVERISPTRVAV